MESYTEIAEQFERLLKLETPPVAIKFVKEGEEAPKGLTKRTKMITFCQGITIARQGGYSLLLTDDNLGCKNAKIAFGLGGEEAVKKNKEAAAVKNLGKYAANEEIARKIIDVKPAIKPGEINAIAIAPLSKTKFQPDCIMFIVVPWQAYYLADAYFYNTGDAPLYYEVGTNAMVCAYNAVRAGYLKKISCGTACTGGRAYAGTESTQMYYTIPWEKVEIVLEGAKARNAKSPYPSLIYLGTPAPGPEKHVFNVEK
ncbi:MAG: DUF169 domain-containing protein [bacterium]|nr:DUF169 domain-containing protein [bacterium]